MIAARIAYDSIRFVLTDGRMRVDVVSSSHSSSSHPSFVRSFVHVRVSVWVNRMKKFVAFVPLQPITSPAQG
jgi:hypothetical protein